jgi:O-antigen/teichoic acid export membrane protein
MLRSAGFRKYLANTSWLFFERIIRLGVVLATGILVARYLGPELFGQLNYASGFVGLFFALGSMGLDEIIVRDLVRHPERKDELLGTSAVIKLAGSVILVILVLVSTLVRDLSSVSAMLVVIIAVSELLRPFGVIDWYFMAKVRSRQTVIVQMVQVFISAGYKILMVVMEAPLIMFAWVYVLEGTVVAIGYAIMYVREGDSLRAWKYTKPMAG